MFYHQSLKFNVTMSSVLLVVTTMWWWCCSRKILCFSTLKARHNIIIISLFQLTSQLYFVYIIILSCSLVFVNNAFNTRFCSLDCHSVALLAQNNNYRMLSKTWTDEWSNEDMNKQTIDWSIKQLTFVSNDQRIISILFVSIASIIFI